MKTQFLRAASLASLMAATGLLSGAAFAADKAPSVTPAVATALIAAQKATAANDFNTAKTQIATARAVASRTPYDDMKINEIALGAAVGQNDMAAADAAAEAAADAAATIPGVPDSEKLAVTNNAMTLALNAEHYDKALTYAKVLQAANASDARTLGLIAKAYYLAKDYPGAKTASQKAIDAAAAAKTRPDRDVYTIMAAAQVAANDEAGAENTLEQSAMAYNNPNDWTQLIDVALGTKGLRDVDVIYLGRLLIATKAAITPSQASIIGETAGRLTFYGDAEAMKEHGGTGFPDPTVKANNDKAGLPKLQSQAQSAKSGLLAAKIAQAQYSYGMYPEAQASAQLAISKGGDPDASEPQMVLAQSLAAQGKYQDAIAAFKAVSGGGPVTARAAKLWIDYCTVMLAPPPAAAQ